MSTISIARKHHLSHKKALAAAQKVAEDLNARFDLDYEWNGDCIDFERPGLSGRLQVLKDQVQLECKLGLLLFALKPVLEKAVHRELDRHLGKPKA